MGVPSASGAHSWPGWYMVHLEGGDPKKLRRKLGVGEAQDIKSGHQKAV